YSIITNLKHCNFYPKNKFCFEEVLTVSGVSAAGEKLKNFINGEWVEPRTSQYDAVPNPATEEILCQVPISTREDLDDAVAVAKEAYTSWSNTAVPRRARILFK